MPTHDIYDGSDFILGVTMKFLSCLGCIHLKRVYHGVILILSFFKCILGRLNSILRKSRVVSSSFWRFGLWILGYGIFIDLTLGTIITAGNADSSRLVPSHLGFAYVLLLETNHFPWFVDIFPDYALLISLRTFLFWFFCFTSLFKFRKTRFFHYWISITSSLMLVVGLWSIMDEHVSFLITW